MGNGRIVSKRVLLTWWGSLERGGETIGDLYAVGRVAATLRKRRHCVQIASQSDYELGRANHIHAFDWRAVDPSDIDLLIFVCGPLIPEFEFFQQLANRFASRRSIALAVSILPHGVIPFDVTLARDGTNNAYGDFAFDPLEFPQQTGEFSTGPGLCLRGHQREYGEERCLHEPAEDIARQAIARFRQRASGLGHQVTRRSHGRREDH